MVLDRDAQQMEINSDTTSTKNAPIKDFEARLEYWTHHFRKDDRVGRIFGKTQPRGDLDARKRALGQVLMPVNLNAMGIPKTGEDLVSVCTAIVDLLHQKSIEALKSWLKDHDEPFEFLTDGNDPRVIEISRIAQLKLSQSLQSADKEM